MKKKIENNDRKFTSCDFFDLKNYLELVNGGNYALYKDFNDADVLAQLNWDNTHVSRLYALEKLLEKDKQREKDGFPRKIKLGKLIKPIKEGGEKTIIIPVVSEEKFYHWNSKPGSAGNTGGTGDGEEGEVIGEEELKSDEGAGTGAGKGESGEHGMGAEAYDIGKILTEQFELPNIQEKGKKKSLTNYTYELSDKNRGHGQILDKKSTLKQIVKTNLGLGNITSDKPVDPKKIIISPNDRIYRILSKERDYESQAIVFFVRDYSGSMSGKPTEVVVSQHIYIYSWLSYQYKNQVETRFVVHDTDAEEVPDFYTYYNKQVAGGTEVSAAYKLVNKIVKEESLQRDYNIYIFHGTDGDDWDSKGAKSIPELEEMLTYANRIGITVATNDYMSVGSTAVEKYLKNSGLLDQYKDKLRMDSMRASEANEDRIINSIKKLISVESK